MNTLRLTPGSAAHAAFSVRTHEREMLLWAIPLGVLGLAVVHLALYRSEPWVPVLAGAMALAGFLIVHAALCASRSDADQVILPITAGLSGLSLVMIYRLRPDYLPRQSAWIALGLLGLLVALGLLGDLRWARRFTYLWGAVGGALLVLTVTAGVERTGARQWLVLGGFTIEPGEIIKLALVAFFAGILTEMRRTRMPPGPRQWITDASWVGPMLAVCVGSLLVLVFQRDLGQAVLYDGVFLAMLYVATGRRDYIALGLAAFTLGVSLSYGWFPHVRVRLDAWLSPGPDPTGRGYQILQGVYSLASGGVVGTGLGAGHPDLMPAAHTDMIFPAIGEELGAAGTFCVVALYLMLLGRLFRVAIRAQGDLDVLVACGLATTLGLQAFLILAGSTRLLPLTGIPAPFLTYGGSGAVSNFLALALLLGISDRTGRQPPPPTGGDDGEPGC
jgi:cell division protein FtsW (lipid II flippase)